MRAYERLLQLRPRLHHLRPREPAPTPRQRGSSTWPAMLVEEMKALGIEDARVDEHCYVYGSIPATPGCEEQARPGPHRPHGHRPGCFRRERQPHPAREL